VCVSHALAARARSRSGALPHTAGSRTFAEATSVPRVFVVVLLDARQLEPLALRSAVEAPCHKFGAECVSCSPDTMKCILFAQHWAKILFALFAVKKKPRVAAPPSGGAARSVARCRKVLRWPASVAGDRLILHREQAQSVPTMLSATSHQQSTFLRDAFTQLDTVVQRKREAAEAGRPSGPDLRRSQQARAAVAPPRRHSSYAPSPSRHRLARPAAVELRPPPAARRPPPTARRRPPSVAPAWRLR